MNKIELMSCRFLVAFFASCLASYFLNGYGGAASLPVIALWMMTALLAVNLVGVVFMSLLHKDSSNHHFG